MPLDLLGLPCFLMHCSRYWDPVKIIEITENVCTTLGEAVEFPRQPARVLVRWVVVDSKDLRLNEDLQLLLNCLSRFVRDEVGNFIS